MNELKGRIAVVTGAARGIGAAVAQVFAEEGCSGIVIADMDIISAKKTASEISKAGCPCVAYKTNISNEEDVISLFEKTVQAFDTVDILVNCAGICNSIPMDDVSEEQWDKMMDVNLKGTFLSSRLAMKIMKQKGCGKIVTMSSISGRVGGIRTSAGYVSSKGAVLALTKYLAKAGAPYNVCVNSVAPGVIDTEMIKDFKFDSSEVPLGRKGSAREVADVIMFLCSERSSYVTGVTIDINGGSFMA